MCPSEGFTAWRLKVRQSKPPPEPDASRSSAASAWRDRHGHHDGPGAGETPVPIEPSRPQDRDQAIQDSAHRHPLLAHPPMNGRELIGRHLSVAVQIEFGERGCVVQVAHHIALL